MQQSNNNVTNQTGNAGNTTINVSVITHAPALSAHSQQQQQTQLSNVNGVAERTTGYSINGILGIQHATDPNGNSIKRKRIEDHGM